MSEVRVCEVCRFKTYASASGAPSRRTVEYVADDGTILSKDWTLCPGCTNELVRGGPSVCPFCLEPVLQDEDPRECPQRPEGTA